jgi:hypothetical protein
MPTVAAVKITPRLDCVVAAHHLQERRHDERGAHQEQPLDVLRDQGEVGHPVPEEGDREQRLLACALTGSDIEEEPGKQNRGNGQQDRRQREIGVRLQDSHHQHDQTGRREDRSDHVEGAPRIGWKRVDDPPGEDDDDRNNHCLEHERRPPADRGGDDPTDQRAGRRSDAAHPADHAEGPRP